MSTDRGHDNQDLKQPTRRAFLQSGGALALGAAAAGSAGAAVPKDKKIELGDTGIPVRRLGRTEQKLPIFAHGGSAMIKQDIAKYGLELISMDERIKMVRHGYERGIRYFDTARIYGESEMIMAEALKDVRENCFIASKAMVFAPEGVRTSVETSLEHLGTDYIDSMQLHGPVIERLGYDGCMPIYEELAKLQEEGLFKYIGLTGHSRFDEMHKLIATGNFDTLLIESGYMHKGYNTRHSNEQLAWRNACWAEATKHDMGVLAMKIMGAMIYGHNAKEILPDFPEEKRKELPRAAIRYVLSNPHIHLLNLGISFPDDIDRNMEIVTGDLEYTNEDRLLLAEYTAQAYEHPVVADLKMV